MLVNILKMHMYQFRRQSPKRIITTLGDVLQLWYWKRKDRNSKCSEIW